MHALVIGFAVSACVLAVACKQDAGGVVDKEAARQVAFHETYQLGEIAEAMTALSNEAAKQNDSSDSLKLEQLLNTRLENLPVWTAQHNGFADTPVVGFALASDTAAVDSIISQYRAKFLPRDLKLAWVFKAFKPNEKYAGPEVFELIALKIGKHGTPAMDGSSIIAAKPEKDEKNGYLVTLNFDESGTKEFAKLTFKSLKRNIAIVLNDKVYCYPAVKSRVKGGQVQLTGNFTEQEVNDFVNFLYGKQ